MDEPPRKAGASGARPDTEVVVAGAILVGVLAVLDVVAIHDATLLLSTAPFLLLALGAQRRIHPGVAATWIAGLVLLGGATGHGRYAGLAYTAIALLVLQGASRILGEQR